MKGFNGFITLLAFHLIRNLSVSLFMFPSATVKISFLCHFVSACGWGIEVSFSLVHDKVRENTGREAQVNTTCCFTKRKATLFYSLYLLTLKADKIMQCKMRHTLGPHSG